MSLQKAATDVRENAHAPYSNFKVGAAVQTKDGSIFAAGVAKSWPNLARQTSRSP